MGKFTRNKNKLQGQAGLRSLNLVKIIDSLGIWL